jgi:hypothetical protein
MSTKTLIDVLQRLSSEADCDVHLSDIARRLERLKLDDMDALPRIGCVAGYLVARLLGVVQNMVVDEEEEEEEEENEDERAANLLVACVHLVPDAESPMMLQADTVLSFCNADGPRLLCELLTAPDEAIVQDACIVLLERFLAVPGALGRFARLTTPSAEHTTRVKEYLSQLLRESKSSSPAPAPQESLLVAYVREMSAANDESLWDRTLRTIAFLCLTLEHKDEEGKDEKAVTPWAVVRQLALVHRTVRSGEDVRLGRRAMRRLFGCLGGRLVQAIGDRLLRVEEGILSRVLGIMYAWSRWHRPSSSPPPPSSWCVALLTRIASLHTYALTAPRAHRDRVRRVFRLAFETLVQCMMTQTPAQWISWLEQPCTALSEPRPMGAVLCTLPYHRDQERIARPASKLVGVLLRELTQSSLPSRRALIKTWAQQTGTLCAKWKLVNGRSPAPDTQAMSLLELGAEADTDDKTASWLVSLGMIPVTCCGANSSSIKTAHKDHSFLYCERCHLARFCSARCQVTSWNGSHKHVCRAQTITNPTTTTSSSSSTHGHDKGDRKS